MSKTKKIKTLSLFSGAGGLDIGFAQAGFEIVACVELEEKYCKTLRANRDRGEGIAKYAEIYCQDVRDFRATKYKAMGIECVIGGPPCQTFSAAGRRSGGVIGTEDERGQLFKSYCRILNELKPRVFVFENVYGLPGANGGGPWREIISAFSKLGYKLSAEVVDAADYGVPQHRERLIMVGYREGDFTFPMPTHGPDSVSGVALASVEDAIADLQDPSEPYHDNLGGLYGHLLPQVPEGLNYAYFTAEMGHPEPVFAWRSKFHDLLYKVSRSEPCRTIKAQPGKFTGPFHWKNRHFSVAELKRLQSFPDDYEIVGSFGKIVEQIGNSVPPRLAFVIASAVRDQLISPSKQQTFRVRPVGFRSTFRQRQRERSARFAEVAQEAIKKIQKIPSDKGTSHLRSKTYFLSPRNLFDRTELAGRRGAVYSIDVSENRSHIELKFRSVAAEADNKFRINVSGLRKYLPDFDTMEIFGTAATLEDVFHLWGAIEQALIERSRFFSLIDIYGHYANRGDTVNITGKFNLHGPSYRNKAVNWIVNSLNCGDFISEEAFCDAIGIRAGWLPKLIADLRDGRFDIRTAETHPIIGDGRVLCTYPFPLLSPRALVESRVTLIRDLNAKRQKAS